MLIHRQQNCVEANEISADLVNDANGAPYRIRLAQPSSAVCTPPAPWPVLYLLGERGFEQAAQRLCRPPARGDEGYRQAVVVAITYPGESRRSVDYTPICDRPWQQENEEALAYGGSTVFLQFLLEQLQPWVARQCPIDCQQQSLFGHSLGGLFVLNTLCERPQAFQHYLAASPSVWWGEGYLQRIVTRFITETTVLAPTRHLVLSVGEYEQELSPAEIRRGGVHLAVAAQLRAQRKMLDGNYAVAARFATIKGLQLGFHVCAGANHTQALLPGLEWGLALIFGEGLPSSY